MNPNLLVAAAILFLLTCVPCRAADRAPETGRPPATRPSAGKLQPIEYTRSGGFAGTRDSISVSSDGQIRAAGRLMGGERRGTLTAAQIAELLPLFEGWDELHPEYKAPNAADDFHYVIKYGDKSVTASEAAPDLPPKFRKAAERLQQLAQALPKPE